MWLTGGSHMKKKTKLTKNTKIKYTDSDRYQKHFTLEDRITIQKIISEHRDDTGNLTILLKDIGNMMENDPSTISKEVKLHRIYKERSGNFSSALYNSICSHFKVCKAKGLCSMPCNKYCKNCTKCIDTCVEYKEYICPNLKKFPWVCNGCPNIKKCHLNKYFYYSDIAHKDYKNILKESREGINLTEDEFKNLNHIVHEYIHRQPLYHIVETYDLPVGQRTIYNYIEKGYMKTKNMDLRRKVTYKKRYSLKEDKTILKKIKIGRTYEDYLNYIKLNPDASIVQMDTVESGKDSTTCLLTLHFVKYHFQLAYLLPSKHKINISTTLNHICNTIGVTLFKTMFELILTDNGVEFSDPLSIEVEPETAEKRTNVFYCHPYASREKGACEKNHEYIRYILPKGSVFDSLSQEDIYLMMSHINSTIRPSVKGSPYDFMALTFGVEVLDLLQIKKIDSKLVNLTPSLLK